jgi:DNA-binding transcriptional MocR family regulator
VHPAACGKSQPRRTGTTLDPIELRRLLGSWHTGRTALYAELAAALAQLIEAGHVADGERLPAERQLASALSVSRNTVVGAYDQLRASAHIETRRGSGSTVRRRGSLSPRAARIAGTLTPNGVFDGFLSPQAGNIDLRAGYWIGTDDLPRDLFDVRDDPLHHRVLHGSGYHPRGLPELREALAWHLTRQGLPTGPDDLLITSGAQQSLALIVSLLVDPGDAVAVEDSTYPGALDLLRSYGAHIHPLSRTPHGPAPAHLRRLRDSLRLRLVYLVLSGHNPTGTVCPPAVRDAIAGQLDDDLVVIDDVSLADTVLTGPPPPLAAYLRSSTEAAVVTIGSLSKSVWGGLRIGWLRAPRPLLERLVHLKTIHDIGTPATAQTVAVHVVDRLDEIIGRRRGEIEQRRARFENALRGAAPEWRWDTPAGGLSLWIDLGGVNAVDFAAHAAQHGVELAPGLISSPVGQFGGHLRIPFGQPEDILNEAARRLADAWQTYQPRSSVPLL